MPLSFQCPHCQLAYSLPDQMAGKRAKCNCGQQIAIPLANAPAMPAARPVVQPPALGELATPQPAAVPQPSNVPRFNSAGLWRAGPLLVMRKNAQLPTHLCIKTGEPAAAQRTEQLKWVPGWIGVTLLAGRLVHYAASESHGQKCTVRFGLSRSVSLLRLVPLIAGYTLVGIGLLGFVGNIVWMFTFHQEGDPIPTSGFLAGGLIGAVGATITLFAGNVLTATAIDDNFAVIRGVSPKILDTLPAWPGALPVGKSA